MSDEEALQKQFEKLAECETAMAKVDKEVEQFRIDKSAALFNQRRDIVREMPKFWYIALAEHEDFVDLIAMEDLKFLEDVKDIYVDYQDVDHFTITFEFDGELVPKQTVTKKFTVTTEDGEDKITSEAVAIEWPEELKEINPKLIKEAKGADLSKEDKANYRTGMRSLFAWFDWTGEKPGKEFREGDELARVLANDIYVNAVKYYTVALQDDGEDVEVDSSEGEELDLEDDDDDDDDEQPKKKQKTE
ncbi:hypothetical protein DIURU_000947 [Diutina rugosa]|uniref:Uncharacterized protein n=1 Tax=Diutina rugosa TaxID=5481 RepID=A0A642UY41_DIURU|nr:uncharacterized protein DIURU_000947 [Diutina rugosa]KAA8906786.1 hypothetical protein DIURU_000947 [Diutina rugosa]